LFGDVPQERKWMTDPWLDESETLEARPDDYRDAPGQLDIDRGHQAPLASFKGTYDWWETNYYSNITPQKSDLNQGPWKDLEESVRDLARAGSVVYVMTGPLYEGPTAPLPNADEPHTVPSGYWKIVAVQPTAGYDSIRVAGFIFDQDTPRDADVLDYLVTVDEVEQRSGLDFMWELEDGVESEIESEKDEEWAGGSF
jgi:endonuclease G